jgi:hypothetical protein
MRLPSIRKISQDVVETASRFPLPLISATVATLAAVILIDQEESIGRTLLWKLFLGGALGFPILTAVGIFAEKRKFDRGAEWMLKLAALLLVLVYASFVPLDLVHAPGVHMVHFLLFAFAAHMLVAVTPFTSKNELLGFWQYNKTLFLRLLISGLFAHVMFAGFAFALAALDNLFGMHIPNRRYPELWALIIGGFMPCFFLSGVPKTFENPERLTDYPKALKIFAQHILLPIVIVYLVILYAYMTKILIAWDWPQGWVSKLILGFSGTGILSLLLLEPLGIDGVLPWVRSAKRWFYVSLLPLTVMLFLAIWRRVNEYGITEGRYLGLALAVWLALIIPYFLFSREKSMKFIPASLCVFTILIAFGPWGMTQLSEQSQVVRLTAVLEQNGILVSGKVKKADRTPPARAASEISSILEYLRSMHGFDSIQPWFNVSLQEDSTSNGEKYISVPAVAALMGVEYRTPWHAVEEVAHLSASRSGAWNVAGYDRMIRGVHISSFWKMENPEQSELMIRPGDSLSTLTVVHMRGGFAMDSICFDVRNALGAVLEARGFRGGDDLTPGEMTVAATSGSFRAALCLSEARAERRGKEIRIIGYTVDILYSTGSDTPQKSPKNAN